MVSPATAPTSPSAWRLDLAVLLSFNAGFVDTVGFLGLAGLFAAHVTGNFVTLAAAIFEGAHGTLGKILALPEFVAVVALGRLLGASLTRRKLPTLTIMLAVEAALLAACLVIGVQYGPFPDTDVPMALLLGLAAIAAMALQNGMQRVHFAQLPSTAIMTTNTTQAVLDAVDIIRRDASPAVRARFALTARAILAFALGCAAAAVLFALAAFWALGAPVAVALAIVVLRLNGHLASEPA